MPGAASTIPDWITAMATVITTFIALFALTVYRQQAKTMLKQLQTTQDQIDDLRQARDTERLYDVTSSLLDIREDVERVLSLANRPTVEDWAPAELASAHIVAAQFHLVGVLVAQQVVPEKVFATIWYYSIPKCHSILVPFLKKVRLERDARYWSAFDDLATRVQKHADAFGGYTLNEARTGKAAT